MKRWFETVRGYYSPYKWLSSVFFAGVLLDVAVEGFIAIGFKALVDNAMGGRNETLMLWVILLMLLSTGVANLGYVYRSFLYAKVATRISRDIRVHLFEQLQKVSLSFLSEKKSGDILAHFSTDLDSIKNLTGIGMPAGVYAFIGVVINLSIICILEWKLAIIAIIGLICCVLGPYFLTKKTAQINDELKTMEGDLLSEVAENLEAQKVIKSFNLENRVLESFTDHAEVVSLKGRKAFFSNDLMEMIPNIIIETINVLIICVGAVMTFRGLITPGTLIAFNTLFLGLSKAISDMTRVFPLMMESASSMRRIQNFTEACSQFNQATGEGDLESFKDCIRFTDVSFGYNHDQKVLQQISLEIRKGEKTAFVGGSGSGKTSILNLIMGFYEPQSGQITIDGNDLKALKRASLRQLTGIVLQDNFLFSSSIRDNLKRVNTNLTEEEMIKAAEQAEIHEHIMKLPQGYDTKVGQRGGQLSGGQRQRIAIARALIPKPAILILDEATSALDSKTEKRINETLNRIAKDITLISITHRLENVKDYDQIYVLDEGRVVEQGNHRTLMAQEGLYAELFGKQSGFVIDDDLMSAEIEADRLGQIHLFSQLDFQMRERLAKRFVSEYYPSKATLIHSGDEGDTFYVIVRGKVEVLLLLEDGQEKRISVLEDGDYFGEIALLKEVTRTATVRTLTPCMVLSLERSVFNSVIARTPEIKLELERVMDERLMQLQRERMNGTKGQ